MCGGPENQFCFNRNALSACEPTKRKFVSCSPAMKTTNIHRVGSGELKLWWLLCALAVAGPAGPVPAAAQGGEEAVFKLREVSVFDQGDDRFLRGQAALCQDQPFSEVKSYPVLVSRKPIYGSVRFAADYGQTNGGRLFYFAMDESQGTGRGYDRLYLDLNRDLDLRNDPVVKPQAHPSERAGLRYSDIKQQVIFEPISITFDFGSAGSRPVQIMPRLIVSVSDKEEYKQVTFVRTSLYEGEIKLGGERYQALLGNDYLIRGRLDHPGTALLLSPRARGNPIDWWGGDRLMAVHKARSQFYTVSASPTGDEVTVRPYRGDLGTFTIGPGERSITNFSVTGSLEAKDLAVAVGGDLEGGSPKPAPRCELPVGDYSPNFITVQFGRLRMEISYNYHSDGKPRDRGGRERVYGMTVRKDKPYVLDFSNQPDVMFASPARNQKFKLGDSVEVKAVLVDPQLDFMIRGLEDTTRPRANGQSRGQHFALDPKVVITRANGEKVAEGTMPFG